MHVEGLLRSKGDNVVTIRSDATIAEVADALARHRVGALVVSDDGRHVDGIISERDVVWALAARGAELMSADARSVMTEEVVTCGLTTTVDELSSEMTERRVRHMPVIVDGELAGIVSIGDVVKDRINDLVVETQTLHEYIAQGR